MLAARGFSHRLLALLQYLGIAGHDDAGGQVLCLASSLSERRDFVLSLKDVAHTLVPRTR
jgi:hypothetical protein